MFKSRSLWRGLASLGTAVMLLGNTAGTVLEKNRNMVNNYLGTKTTVVELGEEEALYTTYTADYTTTDELVAAHEAIGAELSAEGSVLLKNNGVLPLAGTENVTLLGVAAETKMNYGARVGVAVKASQNISLGTALTERGFGVNATINEAYAAACKGKVYNNANKLSPSFVGVLPGEEAQVQMAEPSIDDLKEKDPTCLDSLAQYGDAAIVVLGRCGTEGADYYAGATGVDPVTGARNPLALTDAERSLLTFAKENFDKVVVLINASNPMELGELETDEGIDAMLWIGFPGNYGNRGVAAILCGAVNPSGALPDVYASNSISSPAMMNTGIYRYANAAEGLDTTVDRADYYLIEAEGIYQGYRYYETRYADVVMGQGNAASTAGVYDSEGAWSYDAEVVYPFGYGLSYTTFDRTLDSLTVSVEDKTITAEVTVTNTGSVAGKTSAQLYGQAPYIAGGVEKSAVQLVDYAKTDVLEPGASQKVTIVADLQNLASYDDQAGKYILDGGDYFFSVAGDAHAALKDILAAQGFGAQVGIDTTTAKTWAYAPEGGVDTTTFAVTKAGAEVENRLQNADMNTWQPGLVTYLSRSDWEGTWPKTYSDVSYTAEMLPLLKNDTYQIATDDDVSGFTFGADNGLTFSMMKGLAYDDPLWEQLLDQTTLQEQVNFVTIGNIIYREIPSIGFTGGTLANDAPNGHLGTLAATSDENSPWYVSAEDPNAAYEMRSIGCGTLLGATFNKDFAEKLGTLYGNDSLFDGMCIMWGPGMNLHRQPYNGRNCEYYSEDPVLTGYLAASICQGGLSKGLVMSGKHFAFNDQESNRNGVAPYMNEQKARELELRGFQLAFEGGMMGTMTAFNRCGPTYASACDGLINGILRTEWGFNGYIITDMINPPTYMTWKETVMAGTTNFDNVEFAPEWSSYITETDNKLGGDAAMLTALRTAVHQSLYAMANSNLMNAVGATTTVHEVNTWWRLCYKGATYGGAGLAVLGVLGYLVTLLMNRKERKHA